MASPDRPSTAYRRRVLDEFLSCNICRRPFTRPKLLPNCHHCFCQECLEVRHEQWLEACERAERPDPDPFGCPDCGQPVTLPSTQGIAGLLDNQLVASLCEEFSKKTSVTPANTQVGGQKNRCSFHPQEEIKLYCLERACKVPICSECFIESHSGHKVKGVKQEAKQIRNNIRAELDTGREKMETFSTFLREIKELQKRLMDKKVQTQQDIEKACKEQVKKIEEQRDKLLDTLEKSFEDNMAALEKQNDQVLTQLAELSRVCERTEQCMEQEEVVWLSQDLNLAQTLKEKFQNAETPEICEAKLSHFEPKKSGTLIELGKVTLKPMSNKQALVKSKRTSSREVRSTNVRPIRVGQPWVRKVRFGGEGSCRGEFYCPTGVAVSQDNEVYIADYWNTRIQVFTMDGVYIREFTTTLPRETGEKLKPEDVAVDRNDNLWMVSDDHVVQYSREGTCLVTIDLPCVTAFRGITVSMVTEQVIVTKYDDQNGRLRVFDQDGSEVGTYGAGHRSPEPWWPRYVTVDGEGNILVTDNNNHCVHVLDREGNFKFKFGSKGSDESQLEDPRGICVDGKGNIIVADSGDGCVKMFDSQGRFLCHIGSGMKEPRAVTVSPGGDVVVTDWTDDTVSVWTQMLEAGLKMASPDRPSTAYRRRVLDEFLSCNICRQPFTRPKILPCHHCFCQQCLQVRHEQWLEACERAERPDPDPFCCSDCGQPVTLPIQGIAGLPDNKLVAKLCEEFSMITSVTPANTQVGGQKNRCSFHPHKEIKLYCLESACKVPICSECISHSHNRHKITGVREEAKQIRNNIMAELDTGREKMETFSTFLREIKELQKRQMDNKVQTQQDIRKACKEQVKKIEDQRDKLLGTLEKSFEDNMAALEKQNNQVLTQLAELSRVCERTEQCMEQEEVVWLSQDLNLAQTLKEKFQNVQTPVICDVKDCSFEAKTSVALIELGKVTTKPMSNKQSVSQSKQTSSGEVRNTKVRPIRVGQPWVKKVRFGGSGSGRGEFIGPSGVAVSQDNEVYIADFSNSRIQVFTMDGVYIREFTITLPGETGKKLQPWDVAVDRNDNLWVVGDDHVVQYSREGTCLATIDLPYVQHFRGIIVSMATEQVIVTEYDGQNGRLRVFNQDGSEVGTYGAGHRSPMPWQPCYVTVDGEGNILVTDGNNHRVHVLDREGNFKFKFGSWGSDKSQLKNPMGICVDGMGNIVADSGNRCVKVFDSQGRFLSYIGSGMKYPAAVTVSPGGDVLVTDWFDHTVSVWTQD
ncbi:uncharacterized protein LOC144905572 [Branchiostoma floridae x Branchiostoma belcheri]